MHPSPWCDSHDLSCPVPGVGMPSYPRNCAQSNTSPAWHQCPSQRLRWYGLSRLPWANQGRWPRGAVVSPPEKDSPKIYDGTGKAKRTAKLLCALPNILGTLTILFHPQVVHIDLQKPYDGRFLEIFESLRSPKYKITWHGSLPCLRTFPTQLNHPLPHEPVSRKSKKLGSDDASGVVQDVVGIHIAGNGPPIENLLHHGILALNGASAMQLDHCRIFGSPLKWLQGQIRYISNSTWVLGPAFLLQT